MIRSALMLALLSLPLVGFASSFAGTSAGSATGASSGSSGSSSGDDKVVLAARVQSDERVIKAYLGEE